MALAGIELVVVAVAVAAAAAVGRQGNRIVLRIRLVVVAIVACRYHWPTWNADVEHPTKRQHLATTQEGYCNPSMVRPHRSALP